VTARVPAQPEMPTTSGRQRTVEPDVAESMASYRRVREEVERSVLPLATSVDGVSFELQASLHQLALRRGGYVMLEGEGRSRLGQVTDLREASEVAATGGLAGVGAGILVRMARGSGIVLDTDGDPFHDSAVRPAEPGEVGAWFARMCPERAALVVGELLFAAGIPATLDSGGLNRHTFMCGQSGSGKTYSLGVLLERVLAETTLRVVILDPNSDYVGLSSIRDGADTRLAARYAEVPDQVAVWRNDPSADHALRLRFADLNPDVQAAILELDPIHDRDEYAVLADLLRTQQGGRPLITGIEQLLEAETPGARELGLRARNLGILDWSVWSAERRSLVEELRDPTARCTVVDLGSLDTTQEQRLVAEAVLSTLWESRLTRRPCLIVIDEAHNICPADPLDAVTRLSADRAVQIAAEGRKFGLYLLTSTQRPHKVHENVVSQCDNLLLMRMNSQADLADLGRLLSFVPPGLMAGATSFRMGQALVAGKLLPQAAYVKMGERVSEEGGADVPTTWAARRPPS
jgi:DNA helicase HerA-like ATPase